MLLFPSFECIEVWFFTPVLSKTSLTMKTDAMKKSQAKPQNNQQDDVDVFVLAGSLDLTLTEL